MSHTVYTNYWVSRVRNVRKEHGSYKSEEEAIKGIQAWWELNKEDYPDAEYKRTNTGALEIYYNGDNYFYRIEKRELENSLPNHHYKLRKPGEIEALRAKHDLHEEAFIFDELAEPFRDRLVVAMGNTKKARNYIYDDEGRPIREMK